jgi:hypothetical protein
MVVATTYFMKRKAPCGRATAGDHHIENDYEGLLYDDFKYSCGCRELRHFYHDGCVHIRTIRHGGKVLWDERSGDHEA